MVMSLPENQLWLRKKRAVPEYAQQAELTPQRFRLRFLGITMDEGLTILKETEFEAIDPSATLGDAVEIPWPPRAIGLRVVDRHGHAVFERLRGRHDQDNPTG
jgi:hypothetical protein